MFPYLVRPIYAYTWIVPGPKFNQVIGNSQVDPSLPIGASLTLGYGSGGVEPLRFQLKEDQDIDVGIFKLFLTTTPLDLDSIKQGSPFDGGRALLTESEVDDLIEKEPLWDVMTMTLVQRGDPPTTENGNQTLDVVPGNMFSSLNMAQQTTMVSAGLTIVCQR